MGTWGAGPLGNDDACDFVESLMEGKAKKAPARIRAAVETVADGSGYLGYAAGARAVAAAALLAGLPGDPDEDDDEIREWLATLDLPLTPELARTALRAIERTFGEGSELWELWNEADATDEVREALKPTTDILRAAAT